MATGSGVSSIGSKTFVHLCAIKSTPFQMKHAVEFGMEVVSKDAKGDVTVWCLFCIHEGCDNVEVGGSSSCKRKVMSTIKYFTKPFAPFNYRCHLKLHAKSWAGYLALSDQDKKEYFKKRSNASTLCTNTWT